MAICALRQVDTRDHPSSLGKLSIHHLPHPRRKPCICLNTLEKLEGFEFRHDLESGGWPVSLHRTLPGRSSTTLRYLCIGTPSIVHRLDFSISPFFCNLKSLKVDVATSSIFDYFVRSSLRINGLDISVRNVSAIQAFAETLSSPTVSAVKDLTLSSYAYKLEDEVVRKVCESVISGITKLPNLERVWLREYPLRADLSVYLRQCTSLRAFTWYWYDSRPDEIDDIRIVFELALEHIHPLPCIHIWRTDITIVAHHDGEDM